MNHNQCLGHEKQCDGEYPERDMRGPGFDGRAHIVGHDDDQELGEYQIEEEAEFFAQSRAVRLHGLCRFERRIVGGGHVAR